jgi:hypothetical protein
MARKKKEFPPVKERFIGFRVTEDLYKVIETEASEAKMSVSEYCRSVATNKRIILKKEFVFDNPELLSALSNLGKIGSNLNQIARHLNEGGAMNLSLRKELLQCITELRAIRENVKEMAGEYRGNH